MARKWCTTHTSVYVVLVLIHRTTLSSVHQVTLASDTCSRQEFVQQSSLKTSLLSASSRQETSPSSLSQGTARGVPASSIDLKSTALASLPRLVQWQMRSQTVHGHMCLTELVATSINSRINSGFSVAITAAIWAFSRDPAYEYRLSYTCTVGRDVPCNRGNCNPMPKSSVENLDELTWLNNPYNPE